MNKDFHEKRLVYNDWEDLYFVTYSILLILYHLECFDEKREFKDYRKLCFLINIISSEKQTNIVRDYYDKKNNINNSIKNSINNLYFNSIDNIVLIRYVLIILESREIIKINSEENRTNIYISNKENYRQLLESDKFRDEIKNIKIIKKTVNKLRGLLYITFVKKLFKENGVAIWEE